LSPNIERIIQLDGSAPLRDVLQNRLVGHR
jgi:hypothetical protein